MCTSSVTRLPGAASAIVFCAVLKHPTCDLQSPRHNTERGQEKDRGDSGKERQTKSFFNKHRWLIFVCLFSLCLCACVYVCGSDGHSSRKDPPCHPLTHSRLWPQTPLNGSQMEARLLGVCPCLCAFSCGHNQLHPSAWDGEGQSDRMRLRAQRKSECRNWRKFTQPTLQSSRSCSIYKGGKSPLTYVCVF